MCPYVPLFALNKEETWSHYELMEPGYMTPQMRQFGRFLLFDKLGRSPHGVLWRGVRMWPEGVEPVCVEQLDTSMTHHQGHIERLVACAQALAEQRDPAYCAFDELGMVGRQYFVAGLLPEGQRLDHIIGRCEALDISMPLGVAVGITLKRLELVDRQLSKDRNQDGVVRPVLSDNVWVSYEGGLSLGWSAPTLLDHETASERRIWASETITSIVQDLGQILVLGRSRSAEAIPMGLSEWLRNALVSTPSAAEGGPTALAMTLRSAWNDEAASAEDVAKFIESVFQRELSVLQARTNSETRQLSSMPEGARAIIARSESQNIVNRTRAPQIQQVIAVDEGEDEPPIYTGDINTIDLPRLLYRYAVTKVNGRLYLQQKTSRYTIDWRNGRVVRVTASAPYDLLSFLNRRDILPTDAAQKMNLNRRSNEADIVRAIVDDARASHSDILSALETYARITILSLFKIRQFTYAFTDCDVTPTFPFGPAELCMLLNEGVSAHTGAVQIEGFISAHHRYLIQRRSHAHIEVADLHLTTKQLRLWNAVRSGLTVAAQMTVWIAIPGINHDTASRLIVLLERLDLISLAAPDSDVYSAPVGVGAS